MQRKAISVMFMTFIAVSILAATFVTMYLYLAQQGLSATEAQRIYAEAAQERLQVILDRRAREILMNNTGGIGVVVKYLVCLKSANKMASIYNLGQTPIPAGGGFQLPIPGNFSCNYPSEGLYVMTERGNLFMAVPGGFSFELEASPANITLARGGSAAVILKLKAILLETPTSGLILLVAKPEGCLMNTTVTKAVTTTMQAPIIGIMGESTAVEVKQTTKTPGQGEWVTITAVTNLRTTGITTTNITRTYTTTYSTTASFVKTIQPTIIATFTTRTATTVIVPMALTAENLEWWVSGPECFIVYKAINATSGSVLAEAWVKVKAQ